MPPERSEHGSAGLQPQWRPGDSVGAYRIIEPLGAGGMGEVFRARDERLGRDVALKTVAAWAASDPEYLDRLRREARVLASLNHPHIATLHGLEEAPGVFALVMELVEGQSLAQRLGKRRMAVAEVIAIGVQIAEALEAAHRKGIVHRDLKPGNVMLTDAGIVKVVDFGLARQAQGAAAGAAGDATVTLSRTAPGVVMGTHAYMAPEQVQGREVDGRCDIWAFGCVLYRMLAGKEAFGAETGVQTIAAVLAREPAPLREAAPDVPPSLERLVMRCLRKDLSERWQSIGDVRLALQDWKPEGAALPPQAGRRVRWVSLAAAVFAGAALAAGAFWWRGRQPAAGPAPVLHLATLDEGLSGWPSLSGDGSLLAYASDRAGDGNLDIWLKQVNGRQTIRLTQDPSDDSEPSISPDGTKVAFRSERNGGGVYVVPALGGDAALIAPGGRSPQFSPDGEMVAFWVGRNASYLAGSAKVYVVDAGGGTPRQAGAAMAAALYPVWSPKGGALMVLGRDDAGRPERDTLDWWVVPAGGGGAPVKTGILPRLWTSGLLARRYQPPQPLVWQGSRGGRAIFALQLGDAWNLWQIGVRPTGSVSEPPQRLTLGPGRQVAGAWAQSKSGERFAFADTPLDYNIWELPVDADTGALKGDMAPVRRSPAADQNPSLDAGGSRLTYISRQAGLWTLQLKDTASPRAKEITLLTSEHFLGNQVISGDGRRVLFTNADGDILAVPATGGAAEQLCKRCGTVMGSSGDGKRVLYEPIENEDLTWWDSGAGRSLKVALRQDPRTVLSGGRFSPDGKWVAFEEIDNRSAAARVWIVRAQGAFPVPGKEWIAVTDGSAVERDPAWSPNGGLLYFLSERDGFRCIRAQRLDRSMRPEGAAFAVKHLHAARWSLMNVGAYGERIGFWAAPGRLIFSLGEVTGNIWLEETAAP